MNPIEVPEASAVLDATMHDGARIRVRRHGNPDGPRFVMCHGNGFATNAYYPFWRHLSQDCDLLIYDQRNHGENPYSGGFGHHIDGFCADLSSLVAQISERFGPKPTNGLFHSVSAVAALAQAGLGSWPWERLVLFDPPIVPARGHPLHEKAFRAERFLAAWALERENCFDSPTVLSEYFQSVQGMRSWVEGAHELMARSLLRERDGQWSLICPRELEASVYLSNAHTPVWSHLCNLEPYRDRLLILSADPQLPSVRYPPIVAQQMRSEFGFDVRPVAGTTHMLQLERPQTCADLVRAFCG
ncbi:MAG: pimeloyl-ACP methyl ester carboxylesterase [Gammaproteobacteria bacterium]|jgi:pimeloyl-ACP methyl ester carboxylesterase